MMHVVSTIENVCGFVDDVIGMHSTKNLNDGYMGSGKRIKAELKKYGKENFT